MALVAAVLLAVPSSVDAWPSTKRVEQIIREEAKAAGASNLTRALIFAVWCESTAGLNPAAMTGRPHMYFFQYLPSTWNRMVGKYGFSPHYWYKRKVLVYKSRGKIVRKVKRYKRTHRKKGQPMNPRSIRDQAALTVRVWKNETSKEWDARCRL